MLKSLLKEVARSLRPGGVRQAPAPGQADGALVRQRFTEAPVDQRKALIQSLQKQLSATPQDLPGWLMLGDWLLAVGQLGDAESAYRRALQIAPTHTKAQEGLGLTLLHLRRLEESYLHLETASQLEPDNSEILNHWGLVDLELGNLAKAAAKFERAIERSPQNVHAWHNLGITALKQGHTGPSIHHLLKAIAIRPDHGLAYSNLALAYRQADDLPAAIDAAQKATELKLGNARVWVVLGDLLINTGQFDEAARAFDRARSIEPQSPEAFVGLGKLSASMGQHRQAREAYEAALARAPSSPDAQGGLGQLHLLLCEWKSGWDLYEARRRTDSAPVRSMPYREWQGPEDDIRGKLLIHVEQGLGDILLFSSCVHDVLSRGVACVLEAPPRLHRLLSRSFPKAEVVMHDSASTEPSWLAALSGVERHIPIGSLPRHFRRTAGDFPATTGYLKADSSGVEAWRRKLADLPRPHIGLAWRGGLAGTARAQRSMELRELAQALEPLGGTLVCLQYGDVASDLSALKEATGVVVEPGLSGYGDLDDMASLTAALDGVVTVCSTQAHLTGALGIPGIVLVPANPNWRYGASGEVSPWYPSLRLLRQARLHHWDDVLQHAAPWARTAFTPRSGLQHP